VLTRGLQAAAWAIAFATWLGPSAAARADPMPQPGKPRVEAALQNIIALDRPDQDGFATVWDGNKYVQCGRRQDRSLRCEAAGALMQPSLGRVLVAERVARLAALGWHLDPSFGNYVQTFPPGMPTSRIADRILQALAEGYDADLADLEVQSTWVASEPCPPRNGPSQNLAGIVSNAPSMAATAVHACAYRPKPDHGPSLPAGSAAELIDLYGARVTGEIQRLRVNLDRHVFVAFETQIGYIQCAPQTAPAAIYCEAQSADSWPALAGVLSPDRVARLHAAGFADPGRAPNYWKIYPVDQADDAAVAHEVLTVLHDVYGYTGLPKLEVKTEEIGR
jgi:hypothetical protein